MNANCNGAAILLLVLFLNSANAQISNCPLKPPWMSVTLPDSGYIGLDDDRQDEYRHRVVDSSWSSHKGRHFTLFLRSEGPNGSGRYWDVSVALRSQDTDPFVRGFEFSTTTIGWRTLQQRDGLPLEWVRDEDGDGDPELIVWDSFPLTDEPSNSDFALIGWVYRFDRSRSFTVDVTLSRKKASLLADAYRKPMGSENPGFTERRRRAAEFLDAFSNGDCTLDAQ